MRIENAVISQTLIEASKTIEKKDVTPAGEKKVSENEEMDPFIPLPLSSGGTYSVASLKSAVDYYAKFLTVAESNMQAAQQTAKIPQALLDRLNGR
jgi:hypothetical protein